MKNLKISVVIPMYNASKSIIKTLDSVKNQLFDGTYQIVIINDGSTDKSQEKVQKYIYDNPQLDINLISKPNEGVSITRNLGVKNSKYDFIAFLDSDDIWHPQKLQIVTEMMSKHQLDFLFHLYAPNKQFNNIRFANNQSTLKYILRKQFAFKNYIATPTVIMNKSIFVEFPIHINACEDYCCWLDSVTSEKFYYVSLPLASGFKKPIGESGLSGNIQKMHKGFIDSLFYLKSKQKISRRFFLIAYVIENIKYPIRHLRG